MREELARLTEERTRLAGTLAHDVSGSETDREEVIAGRKRVRELDRRREYLFMMLEKTEVVDNQNQEGDRVLFGARVTVREDGAEKTYRVVGVDEADPHEGAISWLSPVAKGLLKRKQGAPPATDGFTSRRLFWCNGPARSNSPERSL